MAHGDTTSTGRLEGRRRPCLNWRGLDSAATGMIHWEEPPCHALLWEDPWRGRAIFVRDCPREGSDMISGIRDAVQFNPLIYD